MLDERSMWRQLAPTGPTAERRQVAGTFNREHCQCLAARYLLRERQRGCIKSVRVYALQVREDPNVPGTTATTRAPAATAKLAVDTLGQARPLAVAAELGLDNRSFVIIFAVHQRCPKHSRHFEQAAAYPLGECQ